MAYTNTFITIADDCPATMAKNPTRDKDTLTRAEIEYNLLTYEPYTYNHLEFTHLVHTRHKAQSGDVPLAFDEFHAKGQPCMRASALVKRYGWGAHYDAKGRIAIYSLDSAEYANFCDDGDTKLLKGMRNKRA